MFFRFFFVVIDIRQRYLLLARFGRSASASTVSTASVVSHIDSGKDIRVAELRLTGGQACLHRLSFRFCRFRDLDRHRQIDCLRCRRLHNLYRHARVCRIHRLLHRLHAGFLFCLCLLRCAVLRLALLRCLHIRCL